MIIRRERASRLKRKSPGAIPGSLGVRNLFGSSDANWYRLELIEALNEAVLPLLPISQRLRELRTEFTISPIDLAPTWRPFPMKARP